MLGDGFVTLDSDAAVLDLDRARIASESEIREALDFEPEPVKAAPALIPNYKRLERQPGDSFLGFSVGSGDERIKLAKGVTIRAFHLPSSMVIGRIRVSLDFRPMQNSYVEVSLYDAMGNRHLLIERTSPEVQFNQVRIPEGDNMLVLTP